MTVDRQEQDEYQIAVYPSPAPGFGVEVRRFRYTGNEFYDANSGLDTHELVVQFSGSVAMTSRMAGRSLEHEPFRGNISIAPAGMDSSVLIRGPIDGVVLRVAPECLAVAGTQVGHHCGNLAERLTGRDDALFALGHALAREVASGRRGGPLYWSSLADALIRRLASNYLTETGPARPRSLTAADLRRIDEYVQTNLALPLDLTSLALVVGYDRFRFARSFRATTGVTPHRYITRIRLERARALLRSKPLSLAEVAAAVGFYDQSHMTNWFRRAFGFTPAMAVVPELDFDQSKGGVRPG